MPKPKFPYLGKEIARGRIFWYVRLRRGRRYRVIGDYGSPEFMRNYNAALALLFKGGAAPQKQAIAAQDTLGWLIDRYKDSSAWERLSKGTKDKRANIFKNASKRAGGAPLSAITTEVIQQGVEDRAKTPFSANDFLQSMRALFGWAAKAQLAKDVTKGVTGFPHKTEGWHVWTEDEIAKFEARWPIGTRERLALAVLLYTGLRRGDAASLGKQHLKNCAITLRTQKTGQQVVIPLLPELARIIDATPTGSLALIATHDGRPMTKASFGNWFRGACRAAGVPGTAHGLRKACATRFAEHGATEEELKAWFAWADGRMAGVYTRKANRAKLALDMARKIK